MLNAWLTLPFFFFWIINWLMTWRGTESVSSGSDTINVHRNTLFEAGGKSGQFTLWKLQSTPHNLSAIMLRQHRYECVLYVLVWCSSAPTEKAFSSCWKKRAAGPVLLFPEIKRNLWWGDSSQAAKSQLTLNHRATRLPGLHHQSSRGSAICRTCPLNPAFPLCFRTCFSGKGGVSIL